MSQTLRRMAVATVMLVAVLSIATCASDASRAKDPNQGTASVTVAGSISTNGAITYVDGTVTVTISGSDGAGIKKVHLFVDGCSKRVWTYSPAWPPSRTVTYSWDTSGYAEGPHTLYARIYDATGNGTQSEPIYPVVNRTGPSSRSLVAPRDGSSVNGTAVEIAATATSDFEIKDVRFYIEDPEDEDEVLIGMAATPPYHISWDSTTVADGPYALHARAYDFLNHHSHTSVITITVDNAHPVGPGTREANQSVRILLPANDAVSAKGIPILITASADAAAGIHGVRFSYSGPSSGIIDTDISPPNLSPEFCAMWNTDNLIEGTYTLTVTAYDNSDHSNSVSQQGTICAPVLHVDGVAQEDKATTAKVVRLSNHHDDDGNGTADKPNTDSAARQDELTKVTLKQPAPASSSGQVTLSATGTSANIRVWTAADRAGLVSLPATFSAVDLPRDVWVEGCRASASAGDVGLKLSVPLGSLTFEDEVMFMVVPDTVGLGLSLGWNSDSGD